ncbi:MULTISPECIES: hypothetical protein [Mesorhizobium]|uniref:hypothetical protein n=1 Tax=Mesorhizobium australicum TaxID=536018 RepID=UPI00333DB905
MKSIMAGLLALAVSVPAAFAGDISDRAAEAEKLLQSGDGAVRWRNSAAPRKRSGKRCPLAS